jgi:hypothetical protein
LRFGREIAEGRDADDPRPGADGKEDFREMGSQGDDPAGRFGDGDFPAQRVAECVCSSVARDQGVAQRQDEEEADR